MSKRQQKMERQRKEIIWNFFEDGIWDIYIGLSAIWIGVIIHFKWSVFFVLLVAPLITLPLWAKQQLTLPRSKLIKNKIAKRKAVLIMGLILLAANILIVFVMKPEPGLTGIMAHLNTNMIVISSMVIGSLTWFIAYAFGFRRLYSYGLLMFLAMFLEAWLFPGQFLGLEALAGLIVSFSGISILIQFMRRYPLSQV